MQDIRQELTERLRQLREQREGVQQQLDELESLEQGLLKVLNSENAIWDKLAPPLFRDTSAPKNGSGNLGGAILELLRDGQSRTMDQLKSELRERGYMFGDKAPGRVINFCLVGLQNRGAARKLEDGSWEIQQKAVTSQ